ncbi:MAG: heat-inducible transcriptional repressor HrcA [Myxococcota bacterium]|jgi:heat-inducible transcriptional repressor|nr:heat-inducible transcriptional repressor HrcA [Myxococcota bacterium]
MTRTTNLDEELSPRLKKVLFTIISEYVNQGRPVSSKSLSLEITPDLSPATVRRAMHELTELGYLAQPHTSAGRVPTDKGLRTFVRSLGDSNTGVDNAHSQMLAQLDRVNPGEHRSWQDVVRLLSSLSYQAALVVTPAMSEALLRQLRFVPCGGNLLLAVVVTKEGLVHNAYVESREPLCESELERIHNYLGGLIEGKSLDEIRRILRAELEDARALSDNLRQQATVLGAAAIESSVGTAAEVVVEGRSRLVAQPELKDHLETLMRVLEEKSLLLELLDRAAATDKGPMVLIGDEGGSAFEGCAIISAPFGPDAGGGRVGVIGPSRMNYRTLVPLIALSAERLSRLLDKGDK